MFRGDLHGVIADVGEEMFAEGEDGAELYRSLSVSRVCDLFRRIAAWKSSEELIVLFVVLYEITIGHIGFFELIDCIEGGEHVET